MNLEDKIKKATDYLQEKHDAQWANEYGSRGYTQPQRGVILANWNNVPKGLADWLEKQGFELEWSDEWDICGQGKAWRTSPDSYSWEPDTHTTHDGELITRDDPPSDWIAEMESDKYGQPLGVLPSWITVADIEEAGYKLYEGDKESGWFPGQTDDPDEVRRRAFKAGFDKIVFRKTEQSQFYMKWEAWVYKESEDGN